MDFDTGDMKIKIIGIGGGGCNAVKRLSRRKEQFGAIDFYAANTDSMALSNVADEGSDIRIIKLGEKSTKGNGAGAKPEVGRVATEESKAEIEAAIGDAKLLFITAGMGGGTGTGGAPVVAKIASEKQILTIGVVTLPFDYEGAEKLHVANAGIAEMRKYVDIMIVVSNQKAFDSCGSAAPMHNIFEKADEVLVSSIKGITDIIVNHSLVNLDFADISTVIRGKKTAHIGLGCATGENRMFKALRMASNNELLSTTIEHAKNIIVNIVADYELTGEEVNKALSLIPKVVAEDARIIHGLGFDKNLRQEVRVTIIATGLEGDEEEESQTFERHNPDELITGADVQTIKTEETVSSNDSVAPGAIETLLKKLQDRK
ncbi:MAG: cell division protein FtsZ [Christensenellales bacterium]